MTNEEWDQATARHELAEIIDEGIMARDSAYVIADELIEAGWVKLHKVETLEELNALPDGSLIAFDAGLGRTQKNSISALTGGDVVHDKSEALPATVFFVPEPKK